MRCFYVQPPPGILHTWEISLQLVRGTFWMFLSEIFAFNMKILIAIFVVYERYILKTNISKEFFLLVYFDMSGRILSSHKKYLYKLQWPNRSRT